MIKSLSWAKCDQQNRMLSLAQMKKTAHAHCSTNFKPPVNSTSGLLSYSPETQVGEAWAWVYRWCHLQVLWCARSRCVSVWRDERATCRRRETPRPPAARASPASAGPHLERREQMRHHPGNLKLQVKVAQVCWVCLMTPSTERKSHWIWTCTVNSVKDKMETQID